MKIRGSFSRLSIRRNATEISTEILLSCIDETYPLAHTMREPVEQMREWAKQRARYASKQWRDQAGALHRTERWANLSTVDKTPQT